MLWAAAAVPMAAMTISLGLLGDPNQIYTFTRSDGAGGTVTDPVAPYPGWLGSNAPGGQYGFFCMDYTKTANWNTSYTGTEYHVQDDVPLKTAAQLVEAAYLSDELYHLGGSAASVILYQGPISFAIWEVMDPTHVPIDSAAQAYILEAQNAYTSGRISAAMYPNTLIFVPDNTSIQDFMTLSPGIPEPGTAFLFPAGLGLIGVGLVRRRRATGGSSTKPLREA